MVLKAVYDCLVVTRPFNNRCLAFFVNFAYKLCENRVYRRANTRILTNYALEILFSNPFKN